LEKDLRVGAVLKKARISIGLTQEKAAEFMHLAPRYVSDIERGKTKGSIDTLIKFCNLYKITPNDILDEFIEIKDSKQNPDLAGFNALNKINKGIILNLIKYFNEQQRMQS